MLPNLLNCVKFTIALLAILVGGFTPLPAYGAQLSVSTDNIYTLAFLPPKTDDDFSHLWQHVEQTAAILSHLAMRGSGRIYLPNF